MKEQENELRVILEDKFPNDIYNTKELQDKFTVTSFSAPYVTVMRKSDKVIGSLQFNHMPRLYFNFITDD